MAKPRVLISSTYFDLKYVRSSLEAAVESLNFEPIMFEKGHIAYAPEAPLDDSCYREVRNADIYVMIIGGRFGSERSATRGGNTDRDFWDNYHSVTETEFDAACEAEIPTYILIDHRVQSEYQTYLKNKDNKDITYAHVDSINIFRLISKIFAKHRGNPVHAFDRVEEIENWLREQWAGLFRELLARSRQGREIRNLGAQVGELREVNRTLRTYLEEVLANVVPDSKSTVLIQTEKERLKLARRMSVLQRFGVLNHLASDHNVDQDDILEALESANTLSEFSHVLGEPCDMIFDDSSVQEINRARKLLGVAPPFETSPEEVVRTRGRNLRRKAVRVDGSKNTWSSNEWARQSDAKSSVR